MGKTRTSLSGKNQRLLEQREFRKNLSKFRMREYEKDNNLKASSKNYSHSYQAFQGNKRNQCH